MSERISSRDIIERLHRQGGMSKKQATSILRAISSVTEAGLQQDGEVRIKGLGTFRLKPVKAKTGRNPKTGERVEIPAHERIVFLPEQSFKEFIANPDELLGYRVPEEKEPEAIKVEYPPLEPSMEEKTTQENIEEPSPEAAGPDSGYNPSVVPSERPFDPMKAETELPPQRKRIHWIIPLAFSIVIILGLVFYLRNFRIEQPTVGSRQSAVGSQQSAVSSQQSAVSSQQSEDRIQKTEDRRQNSEDRRQQPGTWNPGTSNPH